MRREDGASETPPSPRAKIDDSIRNALVTLGPIEAGRRNLLSTEDVRTLLGDPEELEYLGRAIFTSDESFYRRTEG